MDSTRVRTYSYVLTLDDAKVEEIRRITAPYFNTFGGITKGLGMHKYHPGDHMEFHVIHGWQDEESVERARMIQQLLRNGLVKSCQDISQLDSDVLYPDTRDILNMLRISCE